MTALSDDAAAKDLHDLYQSYLRAGFTDDQAIQLVAAIVHATTATILGDGDKH